MSARQRVQATVVNGKVLLEVDPMTAVDLADMFAAAYRDIPELVADRPWWQDDVTTIVNAAMRADAEAKRVDVRVLRLVKDRVQGGESA